MAKTWSLADANFPTIQDGEDPRDSIKKIVNYLSVLTEQLKYSVGAEEKNGRIESEKTDKVSGALAELEQRVQELEERLKEEEDETA